MLNAQITTNQAAREGARVAMLGGNATEVTTRVNWAAGATGVATATVDEACPPSPDRTDDARVTVKYKFSFVTPLGYMVGLLSGDTMTLTGKGVMPCRA
jgi:hypothetical protein